MWWGIDLFGCHGLSSLQQINMAVLLTDNIRLKRLTKRFDEIGTDVNYMPWLLHSPHLKSFEHLIDF